MLPVAFLQDACTFRIPAGFMYVSYRIPAHSRRIPAGLGMAVIVYSKYKILIQCHIRKIM